MAMACVFVAAKIEENCRRLRDVINVFHHLKQKRMGRYVVCFESVYYSLVLWKRVLHKHLMQFTYLIALMSFV